MSAVAEMHRSDARYWLLAFAFGAIAPLLLLSNGPRVYVSTVAAGAVVAVTCIAIGDARTGLIRNAWTGPFATGAALQVLLASSALPRGGEVLRESVSTAGVAGVCYVGMGLLGWVGFGDVKLATGIGVVSAVFAGWSGLLLVPLAVLCSGFITAIRLLPSGRKHSTSPHGPALAVAIVILAALNWR